MSLVLRQKYAKKDAERRFAGKPFHTRGPETAKLRLLSILVIEWLERRNSPYFALFHRIR